MILKKGIPASAVFTFTFLLLYFVKFFAPVNTLYVNAALIIVGLLAYLYVLIVNRTISQPLVLLFVINIFGFISLAINKNLSIMYWFSSLAFQGIALNFTFSTKEGRKVQYGIFNVFFFFFIILLIVALVAKKDLDSFLNKASENFISVMLLTFFGLFLIGYIDKGYKNKSKLIVCWFICMVLAILSNGRAGIIVFALLGLLSTLVYLYKRSKHKIVYIAIIPLVVLTGAIFVFLRFQGQIDEAIKTEGRLYLWSEYLKETERRGFSAFLFGTPFESNEVFVRWHKNLHSSFFELHMMYGVIPLLALIVFSCRSIIVQQNPYIKVLLFCILVRAATDSFIGGELCDIPLYYIVMIGSSVCFQPKNESSLRLGKVIT